MTIGYVVFLSCFVTAWVSLFLGMLMMSVLNEEELIDSVWDLIYFFVLAPALAVAVLSELITAFFKTTLRRGLPAAWRETWSAESQVARNAARK